MPTIKAKFTLKDDDIEKVKQAIATCGEYSERAINDYLHNTAGTMIADSITNFIPRSNRDKVHAKDIKWWVQFNYNLAVAIENQTIGRKSTYYLFLISNPLPRKDIFLQERHHNNQRRPAIQLYELRR